MLLVLVCSTAHADWIRAGSDDMASIYVDPVTRQRKASLVKMWVLVDYQKPRQLGSGSVGSKESHKEFDCKTAQQRALYTATFSGRKGDGKLVDVSTMIEKWMPIIPGSLEAEELKYACQR